MKKLETVLSWMIGIYTILFILAWVDWGFLKSEITAYPLHCSHKVGVLGECSNVDFSTRAFIYKVDPKRQEVLYWVEGFEVSKLIDCAIRNRKNWTCKYSDNNTEIGFNNGKFFETVDPNSLTADLAAKTFYVSRHDWLVRSCRGSWIPFPVCFPFIQWFNNALE